MNREFEIQAEQYRFPYHHIVDLDKAEFIRTLDWGLDYWTYMMKVCELLEKYPSDDVLDVGCGDGFLLVNIGRQPDIIQGRKAIGIDVDGRSIQFASAFAYDLPDVAFIETDIETYSTKHTLITCIETLEHIHDDLISRFIDNIDRILEPEGHMIVSVPSIIMPVIDKHYRHYNIHMLTEYFAGYEVCEVHYMSARKTILYRIISNIMVNRIININFGIIRSLLLGLHSRFTREVSEERGAHIVAVFKKPS